MKLVPTDKKIIVRDPVTNTPLDPNGEEKPMTPYWRRRISDGDVAIVGKEGKNKEAKIKN